MNLTNSTETNVTAIIENFKRTWPVESWKKYGLFDEEYIYKINIHWLQFPPPSTGNFYFLGILYIIFMIAGISGNGLVLLTYFRRKALQTPANALIANLAVSDGCLMLQLYIFIFNSFTFGPSFGSIGCQLYGFWSGMTGTCSICLLTAIALDRYFVIKEPLKSHLNRKRAKIAIFVCWIYGGIFSLLPLLDIGAGAYVPEAYLTSCSFDYLTKSRDVKIFILVFFIGAWLVPFLIIVFAYANIYKIATNSKKLGKFASEESIRHCKEEEKRRQELKLALACFMAIVLWFLSWTPYAVVALIGISDNAHLITPFTSEIPALFCKTSSCLNPFLYAFTHPKFKAEVCVMVFKNKDSKLQRVWATTRGRKTEKSEDFRSSSSTDSRDAEEFIVEVPKTT